jgi:hypothetical protein
LTIALGLALSTWLAVHMPRNDAARQGGAGWQLPVLHSPGGRVLLLMIDGLPAEVFDAALAGGRLPATESLLRSRPTAAATAVSTFPSATSPAVQELLSGRYAELDYLAAPGAVHAFDREERRIVRYVTEPDSWQWPVPTLFDLVAGQPAITVFEGRWDGPTAILTQYNMASQALLAAIGASALSNGDAGPVRTFLEALKSGEPPVVSLVVLNEFDVAAHFYGPESAEAGRALRDCDQRLGEIVATLAATPGGGDGSLLDETAIIIFGDHGLIRSGSFVDLPAFFARHGLKAMDVSTIPHIMFRERLGKLWTQWPDVILVAGGSNVTQVYFRQPSGSWSPGGRASQGEAKRHPGYPDVAGLAAEIRALQGVEHVLRREAADVIRVADAHSEARIFERERGGRREFAYLLAPEAMADPLGYLDEPEAARLVCRGTEPGAHCFHDALTWTDQSYTSRFPGAVPLVPKAFSPARFAGDLIVTARLGHGFLHNQRGDHGSLARGAVLTPLIVNGPGVVDCPESHRPRLVDIYPTASVLLGADPDDPALAGLDGRVLDCVREPKPLSGVQ